MTPPTGGEFGVAAFRAKLLAALTLVVVALTLCGLYVAERSVRAETQHDLQLAFASELGLLRTVRSIRNVKRRLGEKFGDRGFVERIVRFDVSSFLDWGVLSTGKEKGEYKAAPPILITKSTSRSVAD